MIALLTSLNLEGIAIKGYSAFPKAPALLELRHQIVLCHIQDTRWWGGVLPTLQRCNRCILQPQLTGSHVGEEEVYPLCKDAVGVF